MDANFSDVGTRTLCSLSYRVALVGQAASDQHLFVCELDDFDSSNF